MALKLADALGTSPELWIGMQTQYDLWQASQHRRKKVRPFFAQAVRPPLLSSAPARARKSC
jgi:plasmid maintenance system antidote protein VapI